MLHVIIFNKRPVTPIIQILVFRPKIILHAYAFLNVTKRSINHVSAYNGT